MDDRARSGRCRVLVVLLTVAAGCSSGGGDDGVTTPTVSAGATPAPTTVAPTTAAPATAPPTTTAPATTAPATGELTAVDVAAITAVFEVFFGGSTSTLDQKVAVLEDGETYRGMLGDASENEQFQQMSTAIRSITSGSDAACTALETAAGCATVTLDLLIGGMPMAVGIESAAVRSAGGGWLVAASAWCNVVAIGGDSCDAALGGTSS